MITQKEVKSNLNTDRIILVDVRSKEEYDAKHIPSALHIPLTELAERMNEIPTSRKVVTVCGKGGGRSADAAKLILGADWLEGGTEAYFQS